ncbi:MAG: 3'(2'),5'-bisphosphate nucleotidase CysQ [Bacteroidia bacterium]|nr:3'(2'),5'-bisphosphate nucleotidase CysQ [Bacteroidia bacterium]
MLNSLPVNILISCIREASEIVLSFYRNPRLAIVQKDDLSPVTEADMASNRHICAMLDREFPGIPVISEEGPKPAYSIRKTWEYSWILDPLDGTKEFIAGNDEFAINLALLYYNKPVMGIISIPAKNLLYYAIKGEGSWKISSDGIRERLPIHRSDHQSTRKLTALISRSHAGDGEKECVKRLEERGWLVTVCPTGSSYKHVLLAEGSAHLYAKPGICREWDTAPGQIILEEAGGSAVRMDNGEPLVYNKENFSNPDLIMWAPGVFIPL